jgi:hypothetical protein
MSMGYDMSNPPVNPDRTHWLNQRDALAKQTGLDPSSDAFNLLSRQMFGTAPPSFLANNPFQMDTSGFNWQDSFLNSSAPSMTAPNMSAPNQYAAELADLISKASSPGNVQESGPFRDQQINAINQLERISKGDLSMVEGMLREATDKNIRQQSAFAASQAPMNQAMGARVASQNIGNINQGLIGQASQAKIAEQMQAANALADALQGARGLEIDKGKANLMAQLQGLTAGLGAIGQERGMQADVGKANLMAALQAGQANLGSQLQTRDTQAQVANMMNQLGLDMTKTNVATQLAQGQMNDQMQQFFYQQMMQERALQQGAKVDLANQVQARYLAPMGVSSQSRTGMTSLSDRLFGAAGSVGGLLLQSALS